MPVLPCQRHLFDIPDDVAYFNTAYMAPQLRELSQKGTEALVQKEHPWTIGADDFFTECEASREAFGQVLGVSSQSIALLPSVSYGVGVAAANLPSKYGGEILLLDEQFPSNVYPWRARAQKTGERVTHVQRQGDDWTTPLLKAINDETSLVAIPNCHWADGTRVDLEAIGAAVRKVGGFLLIDATQSLGALPIDMERVQPDFVIAAAYKWLMGPYSMAFMYVAEEHWEGTPVEHNWITRKDSHQFAELVHYRDQFEPGAKRYDVGERSNFALAPIAHAALRQVLNWGVENIAESLEHWTDLIAEKAVAQGLQVADWKYRVPHMLGIRFPQGLPDELLGELADRNVHVSIRGDSVRISPHLYTTESDISLLFNALGTVAK